MASYNSHCFPVELAASIGLREAILLQYFYHWHVGNMDNPAMQIKGRTWFYLSTSKIASAFPYFSDKQVRTIMEHLEALGMLIKGNHAANKMLRTTWFSLTDEALDFFDLPKMENAFAQTGKSSAQIGKCKSYNNNLDNASTYVESMNCNKGKRFVKPSLDEIRAYCAERGNNVDPETFFDFYESKGWKVGNQPMKDWRACVRTWERSRGQNSGGQIHSRPSSPAAPRQTATDRMLALGASMFGHQNDFCDEQ